MIYILEGIEQYKKDYELKKIINGRHAQYFEEWNESAFKYWTTPALWGSMVIILDLQQLEANSDLEKALASKSENDLIIMFRTGQRNLKVYKAMKKYGTFISCDKLKPDALQQYIDRALNKLGCTMDQRVYQYFVEYSRYYVKDEINIYTLNTYLKQLALGGDVIDDRLVYLLLPQWLDDDVMRLSDLLFAGDHESFMGLVKDLMTNKKEPIAMMGLLLRNFRIAYKISLYPEKSEKELGELLGLKYWQMQSISTVRKFSHQQVRTCMEILQSAVREIKDSRVKPNIAFVIAMGNLIKEMSKS